MPVLTRFRLDGGTNQQAARKLLPQQGLLRRVVNFDLRRDNELSVRPGFTALVMSVYGSTVFTACDLVAYDGRLFALGVTASVGAGVVLFEYVAEAKAWVSYPTGGLFRMPDATRVRTVGRTIDQDGGVFSATVAVHDGIGVVAYETVAPSEGTVYATVFRASDDATLLSAALGVISDEAQAIVSTAHVFHVVGMAYSAGSPNHLAVYTIDPTTDTAFSVAHALQSVDTADAWAAAAVQGSTGGYVTVGCLAGDLVVRHYNDSHVQQMTRTIAGVVPDFLTIQASSSANIIAVGYLDSADSFHKYRTIRLTTGVDVAGPVTAAAVVTTGAMSLALDSVGGDVSFALNITSTTPRKVFFSSSGTNGNFDWHDAQLVTEMADFIRTAPFGVTMAGFIQGNPQTQFGVNALGVKDNGTNLPGWFQDFGTAMEWPLRLGSLTQDSATGKLYACTRRQNNDLEGTFAVTEFDYGVAERRQTAVQGGSLHIAGGLGLVFDGRSIAEMGFGEKPKIYSLASSNGAGSIQSSASYFIQAFAEVVDARGNVHRGPVSDVYPITTGGSDDTITGTISSLHSFRNQQPLGASYRIVICRTAALADGSAGENLFRETFVSAGIHSASSWGAAVAFTLTTSDDGLRALGETQGTIYTQGQTPIAHQAPPPFSYCWPTNERLAIGGLPQTNQWLQSKLRFPAEAVNFSDADLPQYQGSTDEAILAVVSIEGQIAAFTRRSISLWNGEGPDESGQGSFSFCGFLTREGGINGPDGWKSLCETDEGIFFQRDDDQICMLGHDGAVNWGVGQNVRDELVTYPVVNAACFIRRKHQVVFAVENAAGNAGELLVYDLRRKQWFIWDIWAKALAEYQGRLCYADSSGLVYQQNADAGTGALPTAFFETFDFDFGSGASWGEILGTGIVGTKQGDGTVALDVSFDSGSSYSSVGSWTTTTANNYVTGKPLELKKALPDRKHSRFALKVTVSGGSDTLAAYLNEVVLETETAPGMTRLPARDTQ